MSGFRCVPIDTATAERFRATGIDDRGNPFQRRIAMGGSAPCRHCLRDAAEGDALLLGSYDLPHPQGTYWTPSPIFLHAEPCPRFVADDILPPVLHVGGRLVSIRSYDAEENCLYDLGEVVEGTDAEAPLRRAVDDPRTRFINIHTAKPGCMLCRVERR
jgi:Protein of unknown function (DUF1203)